MDPIIKQQLTQRTRFFMENDKGAFFELHLIEPDIETMFFTYDNAEAARKGARLDELVFPERTRRLYKILPGHDPIEIMI